MRGWWRALLRGVAAVWLVASVAFVMLRWLPGNAVEAQLLQVGIPSEVIAERVEQMGLDAPLPLQYLRYWRDVLSGNWGVSLLNGQTVWEALRGRVVVTTSLAGMALLGAIGLGLMLGLADVRSANGGIARLVSTLALSTPVYWTGTVALSVVLARPSPLSSGWWFDWGVPALVLAWHSAAPIARVTAASIREVREQSYIQAARAKGLTEVRIVSVHVLRVAILPILPVMATQAGYLLSGAAVVETIFLRPGLGRLLLERVIQQDYPVVMGVVLLMASAFVVCQMVADVLVSWLDPRVNA